jgi:hypothetical protein
LVRLFVDYDVRFLSVTLIKIVSHTCQSFISFDYEVFSVNAL